jgi:hypothetical protein
MSSARRSTLVLIAGAFLIVRSGVGAQQASTRDTVAVVESEGASFAHADGVDPKTRHCADTAASGERDVRSGDFTVGVFPLRRRFAATDSVKLYWIPAHTQELAKQRVAFRAIRLDGPSTAVGFEHGDWAFSAGGSPFLPSTISFPSNGRWLLVMTSGVNWGCFIGDLRDAPSLNQTDTLPNPT